MKRNTRWLAASVAALALLTLGAACSGGGANADPGNVSSGAPSVSTPTDKASEASTAEKNFETARLFTQATAIDGNFEEANKYASPDSPAERYLVHQDNADRINRSSPGGVDEDSDDTELDIDREGRSITYASEDSDDEWTWKNFVYDTDGKVVSWSRDDGKLQKAIWSKESKDSTKYVSGKLKSAFVTSSGEALVVVVEWSAKKGTSAGTVTYTDKDGFRSEATDQSTDVGDLRKGEKVLVYYRFVGAKLGGKFHAKFNSTDWTKTSTITLRVR
jgi:hypothetical protein